MPASLLGVAWPPDGEDEQPISKHAPAKLKNRKAEIPSVPIVSFTGTRKGGLSAHSCTSNPAESRAAVFQEVCAPP